MSTSPREDVDRKAVRQSASQSSMMSPKAVDTRSALTSSQAQPYLSPSDGLGALDLQATSSRVTIIPDGLHPTLIGTTNPGREQSLLLSGPSEYQSSDRALCVPADHPIVRAWDQEILPKLLVAIDGLNLRMNHIDVIRLYRPAVGLSPEAQAREEDQAPVVIYVGVTKDLAPSDQAEDEPVQAVHRGSGDGISADQDIVGLGVATQLALSDVAGNRTGNPELAQAIQRWSGDATSADVGFPERATVPAFRDRIRIFLEAASKELQFSHKLSVFVEVHHIYVSTHSFPFLTDNPLSPTRRYETPFQLGVGMDITVDTKPDGRGTGGVFLRLEGRPELFLLTCGHVLADETTTERSPHSAPRPGATVMLLGRNSYGERLDTLAREQDRHRDIALARVGFMELGQSTPSPAETDEENRVIGKVLCFSRGGRGIVWHPSGSPLAGTVLKPGLRLGFEDDWGLIEVNRKCLTPGFKANFIPIVNTLPVAPAFAPVPEVFDGDSLRVSGIAPFSDFYDKPTRVFERGAATGETVGTINSIKSVRREYFTKVFMFNDNGQTTEHNGHVDTLALLVFGTSGPFSKRGDSGSAVIDERGRVLAMVWGGPVNDNEVSLLSYATPMESIFDRIREYYALKPSLVSTSPSLLTTAWNWFGKKVWGRDLGRPFSS